MPKNCHLNITPWSLGSNKKILLIHPTASTPFKYYPTTFWNECLEHFEKSYDEIEIFCGKNMDEIDFCNKIKRLKTILSINKPFNYLKKRMLEANSFIGLDSALVHLASYYSLETKVLWSFADLHRIYPYNTNASIYCPSEVKNAIYFNYPNQLIPGIARANFFQMLNTKSHETIGSLKIPITYF